MLHKLRSFSQAAAVLAVLAASAATAQAQSVVTSSGTLSTAVTAVNNQTTTSMIIQSGYAGNTTPMDFNPSGIATATINGNGQTITNAAATPMMSYTPGASQDQLTLTITNGFTFQNSNSGAGAGLDIGVGTLILQSDGTFDFHTGVSNAIRVENGATLQIDSSGDLGVAANTLNLRGGTLVAAGNATIAQAVSFQTSPTTISVNSGATLTINSAVTAIGFASLTKAGDGTLVFGGANIYSGVTNVVAGTLIINGSGGNTVNVSSGATIGGSGSIGGSLNNNGTIDPGSAPNTVGTLTGGPSYSSTSTSIFHVDFSGAAIDRFNTSPTGLATLNGSVFVHGLPGATPVVGQQYIFLHAGSGGLTVDPATTISDDLARFQAFLGFDANNAYVYFISTGSFADFALTPNEIAVANYLDQTAGLATGDYQTVISNLNTLNATQLQAAYNQLGGESFGTTGQTTINTTTLSLQQVGNHLSSLSMFGSQGGGPTTNLMAQVAPSSNSAASPSNIQLVNYSEAVEPEAKRADACHLACDCCANEKLWNGWSVGYGLGGSAQGGGGVSGASYGVGGFVAGVDRWIDDSTLFGVFGGYLGSSFSTGTPSANVHDNAGQGGLYAMRRGDVLYVSGLVGGQADNYTSHRNINFAAINRTAVGNYDGWQGYGYSELGANLESNKLTLQPYGAMQYIHLRQNSISETGAGSLNLASGGMDTDSFRSFLGTRLRYDNHGERNFRRFVPELQASWLHEYIDASTALNARFGAVGGNGFITNGLNVGRDWALLGAGVTYVVTDNIRLTANYYAQTNDRQTYHVGAGGVSVQW